VRGERAHGDGMVPGGMRKGVLERIGDKLVDHEPMEWRGRFETKRVCVD